MLAGELVQVVLHDGLVEVSHRGVLVATHASRHRPGTQPAIRRAPVARPPRPATIGVTAPRIADPGGTVSFAGAGYYAGWAYRRQQVQVTLVADTVQLAVAGRVIKVHPVRHDRSKEHGAFATPTGGHDGSALLSPSTRSQPVVRVPGLDSGHSQSGCDHNRPFRLHSC